MLRPRSRPYRSGYGRSLRPCLTASIIRLATGDHHVGSSMRMRGLEPPRPYGHTDLNRARLPIPPHPRGRPILASGRLVLPAASTVVTSPARTEQLEDAGSPDMQAISGRLRTKGCDVFAAAR